MIVQTSETELKKYVPRDALKERKKKKWSRFIGRRKVEVFKRTIDDDDQFKRLNQEEYHAEIDPPTKTIRRELYQEL